MVIHQGDIFWIDLGEPVGSEPGYRHPFVVIQNNVYNQSRLNTVIVCELTSNLRRAKIPGNVLLDSEVTNLHKPSVVIVSQIFTVDKAQLDEYVGTLSERQIRQILRGIDLMLQPREVPD